RGMVLLSLASSVYIVTASNPMKEKHTTVAPPSTAALCTPECHSGSRVSMVPCPIPCISRTDASTMNAPINTSSKITSAEFNLDVEFMLQAVMPVTHATYATTQIQAGISGNIDVM